MSEAIVVDTPKEEEEVEGEGEEEFSKIIRTPGFSLDEPFDQEIIPGINTVPELFEKVVEKYSDRMLYIYRDLVKTHTVRDHINQRDLVTKEFGEPKTMTYKQVFCQVRDFSSGIRRVDLERLDKGSKEWMIAAQGIFRAGMVVVTAYANLGYSGLQHVIEECELSTIVCSADAVKEMDLFIAPKCPSLKNLVVVGKPVYKSMYFKTMTFEEVLNVGTKYTYITLPPRKEDLAVIMYTSGTTGEPKGVMMSQQNLTSVFLAVKKAMQIVPTDRYISYLPLAHVFELAAHMTCIFCGICVGMGNPRTLICKPGGAKKRGDLEVIRPTIIVGVPRVWDTIKKAVLAKIRAAGILKRKLFENVFRRKSWYLENGDRKSVDVLGESIVFGKIRNLVGGNLRVAVSGGAPLSQDTHIFLQTVLGTDCKVSQGYGLTETCAGNFWTSEDPSSPFSPNTIGWPIRCCEARLRSVREMGYSVKNDPPKGELCIRGPIVTEGYYKRPELTAESYVDGWFLTGDICVMNKDDSITIVDRKKNIVKLSQGEYIAPESLEMIYSISPFVFPNGICVVGNPFKSYAIAIVIVDPVYLREWMKLNEEKVRNKSMKEVIKSGSLKKDVLKSFNDLGEKYGKKNFEKIRDVVLTGDLWTPENGMLTASSKLKRRNIFEKYKEEMNEIYTRIV